MWFRGLMVLAVLATVAPPSVAALAETPGDTAEVRSARTDFVHPVSAPISGGFELENGQYGAGRRGVEYATRSGDPVGAAGPGIVSFAGAVAGRMSITVTHADGLRSTVTGLTRILVSEGDLVLSGQVIAGAAPGMLLTIREGGVYLDPALFLPRRTRHARLVPSGSAMTYPGVGSS